MAKIGHLIICESFGRDEENRRFLINPKVMFFVNELKSNIDFIVSIGVYDINDLSFQIAVEVLNPEGDLISRKERELSHPEPKDDLSNVAYSAVVNVGFKEVLIQQEGEYTVKVIIEGEEKNLTLPILQRSKEVK